MDCHGAGRGLPVHRSGTDMTNLIAGTLGESCASPATRHLVAPVDLAPQLSRVSKIAPDVRRCEKTPHLTPTAALISQHRETIVRNSGSGSDKGRQIEPAMGRGIYNWDFAVAGKERSDPCRGSSMPGIRTKRG